LDKKVGPTSWWANAMQLTTTTTTTTTSKPILKFTTTLENYI
jgi:hypothetical protein